MTARSFRAVFAGILAGCPAAGLAAQTLALQGGRYLDVEAGTLRPNGVLVVRDGRIAELIPPGTPWQAPANTTVIDASGKTVLPGLIDAHVHLTLAGDPGRNALATLKAGFTTVADLGSAGGAGLALRDAIAAGRMPGPRVIAAGSWIGIRGGVCEFGGATVGTAAEAAERVRSDLAAGAELLKACVTGWPAEAAAAPDSVQLKAPMLQAVADLARAARAPLVAHAIGRAGAVLAAEAGARALAHTPIVDSAAAARLAGTGVRVISTLATLGRGPEKAELLRSIRLLRHAGVPVVFGTDAGVLPHGANAREFPALVEAGLSPLEALRAATVAAAALLGLDGVGRIAVGGEADLVVVEGDPLADLRVLERPSLVIKAGRVVP